MAKTIRAFLTLSILTLAVSNANAANTADVCKEDYLRAYLYISKEMQRVVDAVNAKQLPPNLRDAAHVCTAFETNYAGVECTVPNTAQVAATKDYEKICTAVRDLSGKLDAAPTTPPETPVEVTDATPVAKIPLPGLAVKITNVTEVQRAFDNPRKLIAINGELVDMLDSIMNPGKVRCVLALSPVAKSPVVSKDEVIQVGRLMEGPNAGVRMTRVYLSSKQVMIDCSSNQKVMLTLGELKTAFNGLLELSYTAPPAAPNAPAAAPNTPATGADVPAIAK